MSFLKVCFHTVLVYIMPCIAGPNRNMADVRISGNDINVTVTAPDTIDFNITDDDVAVEVDERYPVTIIPNDPSVVIRERMATIVIVDDVDSKFNWQAGASQPSPPTCMIYMYINLSLLSVVLYVALNLHVHTYECNVSQHDYWCSPASSAMCCGFIQC